MSPSSRTALPRRAGPAQISVFAPRLPTWAKRWPKISARQFHTAPVSCKCCRKGADALRTAPPDVFRSVSEWIGPNLEVDDLRICPFPRLAMEWRACAPCCPDSLSLPSAVRVVDAPVHSLCEKAHRIGNAHDHEFPVHQSDQ